MSSKIQTAVIVLATYLLILAGASFVSNQGLGLKGITGFDVYIQGSYIPDVANITLNSTTGRNRTNEDISVYFAATDADEFPVEPLKNITDWRLNEISIAAINMPFENHTNFASSTTDYSTHMNNGTVLDAHFTNAGGFDSRGAYSLNGTGFISVADSNSLDMTDTITITAWINKRQATNAAIVSKYGAWELFSRTSGVLNFTLGANSVQTTTPLSLNSWYFVAATYDQSSVKIYVNGNLDSSASGSGAIDANAFAVTIGSNSTPSGTLQFNGTLDEIRVYNRSLSSDQIALLYANNLNRIDSSELVIGQNWSVAITPHDGTRDGYTRYSNNITILANVKPIVSAVLLNTTYGRNGTTENLTLNYTVFDQEGDETNHILDWRINEVSIAVLNLPFEIGTSNSTFTKDYSTFQRNGFVNGSTFSSSAGHNGKGAYLFDGTNDQIKVTDGSLIGSNENGSIALWIYSNQASLSQVQGIYDENTFSYNIFGDTAFGIKRTPTNRVRFDNLRSASIKILDSSSALTWNQWNFIVVTWNATRKNLYINGVLDNTTIENGATNEIINTSMLGRSNQGAQFNGTIDAVAVYNRMLSPQQIALLYANKSHIIFEKETRAGQNWSAAIIANDGFEDGFANYSNNVSILNEVIMTSAYPNSSDEIQFISSSLDNLSLSRTGSGVFNISFNISFESDILPVEVVWSIDGSRKIVDVSSDFTSDFNTSLFLSGIYNISALVNQTNGINDTFNFALNLTMLCSNPIEGLNITSSTSFCPGTYNLAQGVNITASNITVVCNQTIFNGSGTSSGYGIAVSGRNNVTITGCLAQNYLTGILADHGDSIIISNSIISSSSTGIHISGSDSSFINRSKILNNTIFNSSTGIHIENLASNNSVIGNIIFNSSTGIYISGTPAAGGTNIVGTLANNTIVSTQIGIHQFLTSFFTIRDNTVSNAMVAYQHTGGANNTLESNIFLNASYAIHVVDTGAFSSLRNIYRNNTFINTTFDFFSNKTSAVTNVNSTFIVLEGLNEFRFHNHFINLTDVNSIFINDSIVSLNVSAEPQMNLSANISFVVSSCQGIELSKADGFFTSISAALSANPESCYSCSNLVCADNRLNFTTTSFSTIFASSSAPNITVVGPNASNTTQPVLETESSIATTVQSNATFNATVKDINSQALTFSWFVDGVLRFTETITNSVGNIFTSLFNFLFTNQNQHNVTVIVNDSYSNDTFSFFTNVSCITPSQRMIINSSILLCGGFYQIDVGMNITASNVVVQCNQTIINGTTSSGSFAFFAENTTTNVTIMNCDIRNQPSGIFIKAQNSTIFNNSFFGNFPAIFAQAIAAQILNNSIVGSSPGILSSGNHSYVSSNTVTNTSSVAVSISGLNITVKNNFIFKAPTGISSSGTSSFILENNITNAVTSISPSSTSELVQNNILTNTTTGISMSSRQFVTIFNNTISLATTGISSTRDANLSIINNTISATNAISFTATKNATIKNNIFSDVAGNGINLGSTSVTVGTCPFCSTFYNLSRQNLVVDNAFNNVSYHITTSYVTPVSLTFIDGLALNTLIKSDGTNSISFIDGRIEVQNMSNIFINNSIVMVNASNEGYMNQTANVSLSVSSCSVQLYNNSGYFTNVQSALPGSSVCSSDLCRNQVCANNQFNFTANINGTIFAYLAPNITGISPNGSSNFQVIGTNEENISITKEGTNTTFNITFEAGQSALTVNWFVNGILQITETLTNAFSAIFSFIFSSVGLFNVTAVVNDSSSNDTFTFFVTATCAQPVNGLNVTNSTTLCPGLFQLTQGIRINASSVVVSCNQTVLNGSGSGSGIAFDTGVTDATVTGCMVQRFSTNINFNSARNNSVRNSVIASGTTNIDVSGINNTMINNVVANSSTTGVSVSGSENKIINNTILSSSSRGIFTTFANFNIIAGNLVSGQTTGIWLAGDNHNNSIENNTVLSSTTGMFIANSDSNRIIGNTINGSSIANLRFFQNSNSNLVENNKIVSSLTGIGFIDSSSFSENNTFINTTFSNNTFDFAMQAGVNNTLLLQSATASATISNAFINYTKASGLVVSDRVVAFNLTQNPQMNLSAAITFSGLSHPTTPTIYVSENFITNPSTIVSQGTACTEPRCYNVTYNATTGVLQFNVTGFSSYAVDVFTAPSTSSGGSSGGGSSSSVVVSCTANFTCGDWSACINSEQRRTCIDTKACSLPKSEFRLCTLPTLEQPTGSVVQQPPAVAQPEPTQPSVPAVQPKQSIWKNNVFIGSLMAFVLVIVVLSLIGIERVVRNPARKFRGDFDVQTTRNIIAKAQKALAQDKQTAIKLYNDSVRAYQPLTAEKKKLFEKDLKELKRKIME